MIVNQAAAAAAAERSIVASVSSIVGPRPIILAGSRATGEASPESDYDVYVVLSMWRAVRHLGDLRRISDSLTSELGVTVTLNPLPVFRFERPGRTLIVWKLRREGRALAPPSYQLGAPLTPAYDAVAVASYALSGLRYLGEELEPRSLAEPCLQPAASARVRKALRHAVQIELLRDGRYESVLADAIDALPSASAERFRSLDANADRSSTWFAVRDCLIAHALHPPVSAGRRLVLNAQYVALRALRTRRFALRPLLSSRAVPEQLGDALVALILAVEPKGTVDEQRLRSAAALLPEIDNDDRAPSWLMLRDHIDAMWADACPLVGF